MPAAVIVQIVPAQLLGPGDAPKRVERDVRQIAALRHPGLAATVDVILGEDGALYIVDIARGVIQHKGFLTYYLVKNIQDRKLETPRKKGQIRRQQAA